jgi:hypothetical protein
VAHDRAGDATAPRPAGRHGTCRGCERATRGSTRSDHTCRNARTSDAHMDINTDNKSDQFKHVEAKKQPRRHTNERGSGTPWQTAVTTRSGDLASQGAALHVPRAVVAPLATSQRAARSHTCRAVDGAAPRCPALRSSPAASRRPQLTLLRFAWPVAVRCAARAVPRGTRRRAHSCAWPGVVPPCVGVARVREAPCLTLGVGLMR